MYTLQQNLKVKIDQMEAKFRDEKENVFQKKMGTYILAEVLKNKFLWQSDHGLCHQTTVYRSRKFAKNQENLDILQRSPSY